MNSRDNLRQAAKDFFGVDTNKGVLGQQVAGMQSTPASAKHRAELSGVIEDQQGSANVSEMVVLEPRKQTSVIAEGTSIVGRIRSSGHIEIMGKVDGNVEVEGDVTVCGRVTGNISGDQLRMLSCQVKGNLEAASRVIINSESTIIGDVHSDSIVMDGKLKGNVVVSKTATFNSNSYVLGDITTTTISIDEGAVINGMVKTFVDFDADSPFDKI